MPDFKKSDRPAKKYESRSPKAAGGHSHRGFRPDTAAPAKKRWNADERAARTGDRRPNWTPREDQASSTIDHKVLLIEQRDKRAVIQQLASGAGKTLIFARTRAFTEELADQLDDAGVPATSLHGDLNQARPPAICRC